MPAVGRQTAIRREPSAARCIPYTAHVADGVVRMEAGDYLQVFRLGGASFESADDAELNNWHERLNVLWRNVASPNVALWTHIIRRRERIVFRTFPMLARLVATLHGKHPFAESFADALASKYEQRLSGETLMI